MILKIVLECGSKCSLKMPYYVYKLQSQTVSGLAALDRLGLRGQGVGTTTLGSDHGK